MFYRRKKNTYLKKYSKGFFLIEVVVASAVVAVVLILLVGSVKNSADVSKRSLERMQAAYLLEEGVEAAKVIRNQAWSAVTAATADTPYYLSWGGSSWSLSSTPSTIDTIFTRTIIFSDVVRDPNDDIASTGTSDTGTRKGTVTVTWQAPSGTKTESLSFYISDI